MKKKQKNYLRSQNKKVVLVSNVKKNIDDVSNQFKKSKKVLSLTSDFYDKTKKKWEEYYLLAFSPVVTAGYIIRKETFFDNLYCYFSDKSSSP